MRGKGVKSFFKKVYLYRGRVGGRKHVVQINAVVFPCFVRVQILRGSARGPHHMEDLYEAGGVYAVMHEIDKLGLLRTAALTTATAPPPFRP